MVKKKVKEKKCPDCNQKWNGKYCYTQGCSKRLGDEEAKVKRDELKDETAMERLLQKKFKEYWDGCKSFMVGNATKRDAQLVEAVASLAYGWGFRNAYIHVANKTKRGKR